MSWKLFLFCVTLVTCTHHQASGWVHPPAAQNHTYYHLIAPGTILSNSDYPISISLTESQSHKMWWFWMILRVRADEMHMSASADDMKVYPGTTTLSRFSNSELFHREGRISMSHNGSTPLGSPINVENRNYSAYIQTDKAKYKPGEVVQFRVIFLDRFTRPVNVTSDDIFVRFYDGLGNQIKEFSNVVSVQGVHKGYLQIADYPALGEWKIEVKSGSHHLQEKSFQVARYVSPMFMVNFSADKDVAFDRGEIGYSVQASYPNGERVQGNLTIQFNTTYSAVDDCYSNYTLKTDLPEFGIGTLSLNRVFNFTRNSSEKHPLILYKISAVARVQDNLFGRWSEVRTEISIHNQPYRIKIDVPRTFDPEKLVNISVFIESIGITRRTDEGSLVKLRIEGTVLANESRPQAATLRFVDVYWDWRTAVASVNLTNDGWMEYRVEAEYDGWISESKTFRKNPDNNFKLDVLTERPEVGKELVVQLRSKDPIDRFVYHILSPVDILQFGRVNVTGDARTYPLRINATDLMMPKITLYIHRIQNGVLHAVLKEIYIKRVHHNSIKIELSNAKHGQVAINVATDAGSYVGLMGVKKDQLLERNINRELTEEHIFTALHNFDFLNMDTTKYPASEAGLLIFTNARNAAGSVLGEETGNTTDQPLPARINKPTFELPSIGEIFSESWMFKDFESTPEEGLRMLETVPDAGWGLAGFSLNPNTGLTFTKEATKFEPKIGIFMELPSLVREGEIIEMPVYVTNKMLQEIYMNVLVRTTGLEVESLDTINSHVDTMITVSRHIPRRDKAKFVFLIRSQAPGVFNVTVRVTSYEASAAVKQKTITVVPEGVPTSYSRRYWRSILKPYSEIYSYRYRKPCGDFEDVLLETPENAIDGSVTLQLTVVGDVFSLLTRRLQEQVHIPTGNCADTVRYMMANLLILKYMKALNHSNSIVESMTKLRLEQAYQNLLAFRQSDGSFSRFSQSRVMPDVWLTTSVLWVLEEARHFIVVDPLIIHHGLNYLYSKQIQRSYFGSGTGAKDDILLTAFALVSCLQNDTSRQYLRTTVRYLHEVQRDMEDPLTAGLSTYAMALSEQATTQYVLNQLINITLTFRDYPLTSTQRDSLQAELETTAEYFISLLEPHTNHILLPIVKALMSIDQDEKLPNYLLALEAMIKIAAVTNLHDQDFIIHIRDKGGSFRNVYALHRPKTIRLSPRPGELRLTFSGFGLAIVDVRWNYRILAQNQSLSSFKANVTVEEPTTRAIVLKICIATKSPVTKGILSMVELNLQSGYTFDEGSFETAFELNSQIRSIQFNGHDGSVLVYVQDVFENGTCIQLDGLKTWQVYDAKPGSLIVYDSHKQDDKSIIFFSIPDKDVPSSYVASESF